MYVLQEGNLYNTDDGRKALRDIFALNLFENVQVCHHHWYMSKAHLHDIASWALPFMPFLSSLHCSLSKWQHSLTCQTLPVVVICCKRPPVIKQGKPLMLVDLLYQCKYWWVHAQIHAFLTSPAACSSEATELHRQRSAAHSPSLQRFGCHVLRI